MKATGFIRKIFLLHDQNNLLRFYQIQKQKQKQRIY